MPNIASAKKRLRQNVKRRARNRARKRDIRLAQKQLLALIEGNDLEGARKALDVCFSRLDKAAKRGAIHRNKADRKKSRLAAKLQMALAGAATTDE
ncbi:MAG: 30S ribosomal protein S20 [Kiritimatiellaeota bacterium]|nr:30S ribosomal protein S20 [Kiritimatiellota bacterium]